MSIGIGEVFRDARRRAGCSLADASADTRVRESYLAAIEEEDFAGLGGDVYVKGFITSYAKFLGLDPTPLLDAYRGHVDERERARAGSRQGPRQVAAPAAARGVTRTRERPAGAAVLLVLVLLVMVALIALSLRGGGGDASTVTAWAPLVAPTWAVHG